jgi:tRNA pseudouridine32 synthase/23S rRNA pseudouridine746 synthase
MIALAANNRSRSRSAATTASLLLFTLALQKSTLIVAFSSSQKRSLKSSSSSSSSSKGKVDVVNPITARRIQVGGPTFRSLLEEEGFVFHNGQLNRVCYHLYGDPKDGDATSSSLDDWYEVDPNWSSNDNNNNNGLLILHEKQEKKTLRRDQVLFVHKPAGLLSVAGIGPEKADCLAARVATRYPKARICHRLDRDTSGVMVFGLTPEVHSHISKLFELRQTLKTYSALVNGHPEEECGVVDMPIGKMRTEEGYNRWVVNAGEKQREARTEWTVEKRFEWEGIKFSRMRILPLTGRGQQVRLHMMAIGHSLLGDTLHSSEEVAKATPRLCLHATTLQLNIGGESVEAHVPPPF